MSKLSRVVSYTTAMDLLPDRQTCGLRGMPGTFSPPPTWKETSQWPRHASRHHVRHARAVMHSGIANPRWRGKRSRLSRLMLNPQFYVSGKRHMGIALESVLLLNIAMCWWTLPKICHSYEQLLSYLLTHLGSNCPQNFRNTVSTYIITWLCGFWRKIASISIAAGLIRLNIPSVK